MSYTSNNNTDIIYTCEDLKKLFSDSEINFVSNFDIRNVSMNSREISDNGMFIAIKTKNVDGHDYILDAIEKGAICIICEKSLCKKYQSNMTNSHCNIIFVENSVETLKKLAAFNRNKISTKIIGITGSLGKTTVKKTIHNILRRQFNTTYAKDYSGNISSLLALASVTSKTKVLILEFKLDELNNIGELSDIVKPNIVLITTIIPAHSPDYFTSSDVLIDAKLAILNGLKSNGVVILNQRNKYFDQIIAKVKKKGIKNIITIGKPMESNLYMDNFNLDLFTTYFRITIQNSTGMKEDASCTIGGIGYHNAFNTMFSFAVAKLFQMNIRGVAKILSAFYQVIGRCHIEKIKTLDNKLLTVTNDSYNSSSEALNSAISTLDFVAKRYKCQRSMFIVGDIWRINDTFYDEFCDNVTQHIIEHNIDFVFTIGDESHKVKMDLPKHIQTAHFDNIKPFIKHLRTIIQDGDILLSKALGEHRQNVFTERLHGL